MSGLNEPGAAEPDLVVVSEDAVDQASVARPAKPLPVWVRLTFDDGRPERTEKGFARAWTDRHVLVQVLWPMSYYLGAREFWVDAGQVTRRAIDPQWLGRSDQP